MVQKRQVFLLWNSSYPKEIEFKKISEFDDYINQLLDPIHFLVLNDDGVTGWLALFQRDSLTQFAMIVHPEFKRIGIGKSLLLAAKKRSQELHGWVICSNSYRLPNGSAYTSPVSFYLQNGFNLDQNTVLNNQPIQAQRIHWNRSMEK